MITWIINNKCNFNCAYCTQWHNNLETPEPVHPDDLSHSLSILENGWLFHITGGEPFLEKNFIDICQVITKNHYLSINTNLSTNNIFDFANSIDPNRTLFISSSVHITEREKRDAKLSSYIHKIHYLQKKGFNIISNYVAHPVLLNRIKSDIEFLKTNGIQKVRLKIFRGVYNSNYYPYAFNLAERKFLESIESDYPELDILQKSQQYHGLLCNAGQRFFRMDRTGNLIRCSSSRRNYGNFLKNTMISDSEPRPCPVNKCGCPYEGIRNVIFSRGNRSAIFKEDIIEKSKMLKRIMNNPKVLLKAKEKAVEYFIRQRI